MFLRFRHSEFFFLSWSYILKSFGSHNSGSLIHRRLLSIFISLIVWPSVLYGFISFGIPPSFLKNKIFLGIILSIVGVLTKINHFLYFIRNLCDASAGIGIYCFLGEFSVTQSIVKCCEKLLGY